MKIELTLDQLVWIERQADLERARCLRTFNDILKLKELDNDLAMKYTNEMIELNDFLLTLIAKLENKRNELEKKDE